MVCSLETFLDYKVKVHSSQKTHPHWLPLCSLSSSLLILLHSDDSLITTWSCIFVEHFHTHVHVACLRGGNESLLSPHVLGAGAFCQDGEAGVLTFTGRSSQKKCKGRRCQESILTRSAPQINTGYPPITDIQATTTSSHASSAVTYSQSSGWPRCS